MKAKKDNIKKTKKPLSKDAKKIITAGVVFFVLFSIILGVKIGTNTIVRAPAPFLTKPIIKKRSHMTFRKSAFRGH